MNYNEKLKDPRWQRKRLEILQRDGFKCMDCDDHESTLHVHHIAYYGEPWDCPDDLLVTLCENCHSVESNKLKSITKDLIKYMKEAGLRADDFIDIACEYYYKSKLTISEDQAIVKTEN